MEAAAMFLALKGRSSTGGEVQAKAELKAQAAAKAKEILAEQPMATLNRQKDISGSLAESAQTKQAKVTRQEAITVGLSQQAEGELGFRGGKCKTKQAAVALQEAITELIEVNTLAQTLEIAPSSLPSRTDINKPTTDLHSPGQQMPTEKQRFNLRGQAPRDGNQDPGVAGLLQSGQRQGGREAQLQEAPLRVGCTVEVKREMLTDSEAPMSLKRGETGVVGHIDEEGDAHITFGLRAYSEWVFKARCSRLMRVVN